MIENELVKHKVYIEERFLQSATNKTYTFPRAKPSAKKQDKLIHISREDLTSSINALDNLHLSGEGVIEKTSSF